jgi:signal transduction histidine kinase
VRSLTTRFALLLAAVAVFPLLAYGAVSILSMRQSTEDAVVQGDLDTAARVGEQIQQYVDGSVTILDALSAHLQQTGLAQWQQDRILKNFVLEFPEFTELTILDSSGRPVVSSALGTPTVTLPGPKSITVGRALLSPFSLDDDLLPTTVVAIRPQDATSSSMWLVGRLNLEELWRVVDRIRVGEHGYASIVTTDGQLLAHGDPRAKSRVARGDNLSAHPVVAALARDRTQRTVSLNYTDERGAMLGVATTLPTLGWTVIVEQPQAEAFAIPLALERQLAVVIGLALLAMSVIGYFWGRGFLSPILALTRGTRELAAGHLDRRVEVTSSDELGQLGNAFNNMADRLVELQEDVRRKERHAMFGRIASGLVHDLSNPVMNIGNSCKLLFRMFDDAEYRQTFKRIAEHEVGQMVRILDDLRDLGPKPLDKKPVDVNEMLRDLAESMRAGATDSRITITTSLAGDPVVIDGDAFDQRDAGHPGHGERDAQNQLRWRACRHRGRGHGLWHRAGEARHDLRRLRHHPEPRSRAGARHREAYRRTTRRHHPGAKHGGGGHDLHLALRRRRRAASARSELTTRHDLGATSTAWKKNTRRAMRRVESRGTERDCRLLLRQDRVFQLLGDPRLHDRLCGDLDLITR